VTAPRESDRPLPLTPRELLTSRLPALLGSWERAPTPETAQALLAVWAGLRRLAAGKADRDEDRLQAMVREDAPRLTGLACAEPLFDLDDWLLCAEYLDRAWDKGEEEAEELDWQTHELFERLDRAGLTLWAVQELAGPGADVEGQATARLVRAEEFLAERVDLFVCLATDVAAVLSSLRPGLEEEPQLWETVLKHRRIEEERDELAAVPGRAALLASRRLAADWSPHIPKPARAGVLDRHRLSREQRGAKVSPGGVPMSAMKIHGSEYTINKVFSDDFAFEIPHYQRPYRWTNEEAGELLDDLLDSLNADAGAPVEELPPYFLGCIVLIKQEGIPEARVVDGQQRLTTLTVLLAALRETIEDRAVGADLTPSLYAKGNRLLGTSDRYRLLVRDRDRDFFQTYVQQPGGLGRLAKVDAARAESISQENLRANGLFFHDRLKNLDDPTRQRLAAFVLTRCVLVVVSSPDIDSAYRIFSILNNRGLDLSHADILKAEIIGKLPASLAESYSRKWEDAENDMGVEPFKELFAHIRMIYRRQKLRETVLKEFRDYVVSQHPPKELIDGVILPLADAYMEISTASFENTQHAEAINALFFWLKEIDNFDWIPPAIKYLREHRDSPAELLRFFQDLERLAAALMILRTDITKRIERYGKVLTAMAEGKDLSAATSPLQLTEEERKEVTAALDGDIYSLRNVPRYVLLRLDRLLSEGEATYAFDNLSIEHVLPQHPDPGSEWCRLFPDVVRREALVHKLGNLVLLSHRKNSAAQNYDFDKKKTKYFASRGKVSAFALTSQVLHEPRWTPDVIERRQADLLSRLRTLWRL
jgi:hypothetical protein